MIELYWLIKTLLAQDITDKKVVLNDLMMQKNYLHLQNQAMDKNITIIETHLGIQFVEHDEDNHQIP